MAAFFKIPAPPGGNRAVRGHDAALPARSGALGCVWRVDADGRLFRRWQAASR